MLAHELANPGRCAAVAAEALSGVSSSLGAGNCWISTARNLLNWQERGDPHVWEMTNLLYTRLCGLPARGPVKSSKFESAPPETPQLEYCPETHGREFGPPGALSNLKNEPEAPNGCKSCNSPNAVKSL